MVSKKKRLLTESFSIEEITFADYTVLACAIQFNIFDHIERGRNTERFLSKFVPKNILRPLISVLVASGYLQKDTKGSITLSPISKKYLTREAETNLLPFFSNFEWYLTPINAPKLLKNGQNVILRSETFDAITDISHELGKKILPIIETEAEEIFRDAVDVLDLGCGKMGMMIEAAKRNKKLKVIGIEQNRQTIRYLKERLQKEDLSKRINILQADIEDLGNLRRRFDFIILSHIIHWIKEKSLEKVLKFCKQHLKENGRLIITEDYLEDSGMEPRESVRKNLILSFFGYKVFSIGEIYSILRRIGFFKIKSKVVDRRRVLIQAAR